MVGVDVCTSRELHYSVLSLATWSDVFRSHAFSSMTLTSQSSSESVVVISLISR